MQNGKKIVQVAKFVVAVKIVFKMKKKSFNSI